MPISYYKINISHTGKLSGSKEEFMGQYEEIETFKTIEEVRDYIEERYIHNSRDLVYVDSKDGDAIKVGYVYKGICDESDYGQYPPRKIVFNDWVEVTKVTESKVLVTIPKRKRL